MKTKQEPKIKRTDARQRVLEAAEELFAKHGFEAVSIRDITNHCGANVAAINYHFGGRDKLVAEVMLRYVEPINEERLARLDAARQKWGGKAMPVEELIDAFVRPLVTRVKKSELSERLFYKLCGRVFSEHVDALPAEVENQFAPVLNRFYKAFAASLPELEKEELVWRFHFMVGGMIYLMSHQDMLQRMTHGDSGNPSMEASLGRFIRFAAAGFRDGVNSNGPQNKASTPQTFFDF
ncbi:MAG: TetR/AcrR family transcriptional regulator [Luteolibacter sp.]|jgi:AcrR family transcriptional regulator